MGPPGLGEMTVLKIFLFGIIFGATVRFFFAWCASGNHDTNPDLGEGGEEEGSQKTAKNYTTTESLGTPLLPLAEMNDREGGEDDTGGDGGVSNATEFPITPDESWHHELTSLFDEGRPHDNLLRHRIMDLDKHRGQANRISRFEPVQGRPHNTTTIGSSENEANKILSAAKTATPDQPISFPTPLGQVLYDCPIKPPISYMDATGSAGRGSTPLLMSDRSKVRTSYGSEKNNSDASNRRTAEQASVLSEELLLRAHEEVGFFDLPSLSGHKRCSPNEVDAPKPDIDESSRRLSRSEQANAPTHGRMLVEAWINKEIPGSYKAEHSPRSSNVDGQSNRIARPPSGSHREFTFTPTPRNVETLPKDQKIGKEGNQLKPPTLNLANPQLNSRQGSDELAPKAHKKYDCKEVEGLTTGFDRISLLGHRPVPVAIPVTIPLDFTPGSLFRHPRPFGGISTAKTTCASPKRSIIGKQAQATTGTENRPLAVPQYTYSRRIAPQSPLEPAGATSDLLIFQPRRVFTLRKSKTIGPVGNIQSLDFTPNDNFRNPRPFPQTPLVFTTGPESKAESAKKLDGDLGLTARGRLLQDGSLENPMVGRVKLVSKALGKDPKFTYLTWKSAGIKRSRSPHNCQEKKGCRICD